VDSNHEPSGSEPGASAELGYEGLNSVGCEEPQVGIEPTTVRLQGGCSAELSFKGMVILSSCAEARTFGPEAGFAGREARTAALRSAKGGGSWGNHGFPHVKVRGEGFEPPTSSL
jgi:hypothetical protein